MLVSYLFSWNFLIIYFGFLHEVKPGELLKTRNLIFYNILMCLIFLKNGKKMPQKGRFFEILEKVYQ